MSDRHVRALRDLVRHRTERLQAHRARPGESSAQARSRREDLKQLSARARTRLAAAEARRRTARDDALAASRPDAQTAPHDEGRRGASAEAGPGKSANTASSASGLT
jgi:hypothetical protein